MTQEVPSAVTNRAHRGHICVRTVDAGALMPLSLWCSASNSGLHRRFLSVPGDGVLAVPSRHQGHKPHPNLSPEEPEEDIWPLVVAGNCEQPERQSAIEHPGLEHQPGSRGSGRAPPQQHEANRRPGVDDSCPQQSRAANRTPTLPAPTASGSAARHLPQTLGPVGRWGLLTPQRGANRH